MCQLPFNSHLTPNHLVNTIVANVHNMFTSRLRILLPTLLTLHSTHSSLLPHYVCSSNRIFLGKMPLAFSAIVIISPCSFVCSSDTKSTPRISRKPLHVEPPNFTVENTASDGFGWNFSSTVQARIMTFYKSIEGYRPHKRAGIDVTGCFRSAAKCY